MKELLIRFWQWFGRMLGIDARPPEAAPRAAPPVPPPSSPASTAPPTVTLPPPLPPQFDIHAGETARFSTKASVLTKAEQHLYSGLARAVGDHYHILAKVRLWDILWLDNEPPDRKQHLSRLSCRHIDFLLCQPIILRPVLAIELDDRSHEKPEAVAADRYKDELFVAAGLPLLRIPVQSGYRSVELREKIEAKLTNQD